MARSVRNVRKISSRRKPKPIPAIHFIPPKFAPIYKLEVINDNGEAIDFTDLIFEGSYSDGITNIIGNFSFKILDPNNTITNQISEFNEIKIYMDYGASATTLRFIGKIETKKNVEDIFLEITGKSNSLIVVGTNITYNSNGLKARGVILKEIIQNNFSDISVSGIEDDLNEIEVNYFEIPFLDVAREIAQKGNRDIYISHDLIFNYFLRGSKLNTTEAIVEDVNLIKTIEYGVNTEEMVTEVRVYGADLAGLPLYATSNRDTTNTKGIIKQQKIDNNSVINYSQASSLAIAEFDNKKSILNLGKIKSLLLPTLLPGEKLRIANPLNNIPPAYYEIESFTHSITQAGLETIVIIKRDKTTISRVLKENISFQNKITTNSNPNNLDHSLIFNFDVNEGTFDNTKRRLVDTSSGGSYILETISGDNGSWTSPNTIFTPDTIVELEFRINGDSLAGTYPEGTKIEYSLDGGLIFQTWSQASISVASKGQLQIRVNLSSSETQVKSIGAYYSLS